MAEKKPDYDEIRRYGLARAGAHFLENKDILGAKKNLERLVSSLRSKAGFGEDADALYDGTMASKEGIATAIATYVTKDKQRRYAVEIRNLPDLYEAQFNFLVEEEDREEALKIFEYDGDYRTVMEKVLEAQNKLEHKEIYKKEDVEDAEKTLMKYQRLVAFASLLEAEEIEGLINPSAKESRREQIKKLIYGRE